ncbi:hypothetical protein POV27_10315 [Aureisphaera galaxeae]|uniref:hypothetical protein n=1 Tax=Aureisphaera galaxeae TaxID=1538023 RepID=UPI002350F733|nr:hypothetical protein [Aureisphaera galaxeae]MDC8004445.1 hypothetical protein [Aureisphaera galaxeae]
MKDKNKPIISLEVAKRIALIFFSIGTFLFLMQLLLGDGLELVFLGMIFVIIAVIFNGFILLVLVVDLIRKDLLETFFAICIILANIPIAFGYAYILTEFL